jgi:hypothetical protein
MELRFSDGSDGPTNPARRPMARSAVGDRRVCWTNSILFKHDREPFDFVYHETDAVSLSTRNCAPHTVRQLDVIAMCLVGTSIVVPGVGAFVLRPERSVCGFDVRILLDTGRTTEASNGFSRTKAGSAPFAEKFSSLHQIQLYSTRVQQYLPFPCAIAAFCSAVTREALHRRLVAEEASSFHSDHCFLSPR